LAISKQRKKELVERYTDLLNSSKGLILTGFEGLSVRELEHLRAKIREVGGEFYIVKNRLIIRALEGTKVKLPEGALVGTTAIGFAFEEIPAVAKAIVDLAKEVDSVVMKGGVVEGQILDAVQIATLAELPPLLVLQAQLVGLISTPARQVAGVLQGSMRNILNVTHAFAESGAE
jgi:large subunit ribosomal protein L10